MTQLGEWAPDLSELVNDALKVARNVYPGFDSYLPALDLIALALVALPTPPKGLWFVQRTDGVYDTYAGTTTKLWLYDPDTQQFNDISGADYAVPADDFWSAAPYGNRLIFTNLGTPVQYIDVDVGVTAADLPGSPPSARFVSVMDDKVILSCTVDNPRESVWSDVNDSEEWSAGLAGNQEFVDHGAVMGWFPHSRIVMLERGMRGIISTGDVYSFNFTELSNEKGTTAPWSCVELGSWLYYLSVDGFYRVNANNEPINLSNNRITNDFFSRLNHDRLFQVFGTFDPYTSRILWSWCAGDTEYNDHILVYDYSLPSDLNGAGGRFSEIVKDTYIIARLATAGVSLEGGSDSTDMDEAGLPSLDSRLYMAGAPVLIAIGTDKLLSSFAGDTLEATLETGSYMFAEGRRSRVRKFLPMIFGDEADEITVIVSKKARPAGTWVASSAISQQASGWHPMNADGMLFKFLLSMPAAKSWTHIQSWLVDSVPTSGR